SRNASRPRLVAPASLLVGYPEGAHDAGYDTYACKENENPPCAPSHPMTGTSVATAITSAAAAGVWALEPRFSANNVMETLYDTGQSLDFRADYCLGPQCQEIHRVSMCGAMVSASKETVCPTQPLEACLSSQCAPRGAYPGGSRPKSGN